MQHLPYTADQVATKATYVASGATAAAGAWSAEEWGIAIGAGVALLTYVTTLVFQLRRDRRDQERLDIQREEHDREE